VLEGVSRRTAIELCRRLEIPLRIEAVPASRLERCDEVFLTSTGGGILPIAKVDGRPLPGFPGAVSTRLQRAYWALHDEPQHRDEVDYRP